MSEAHTATMVTQVSQLMTGGYTAAVAVSTTLGNFLASEKATRIFVTTSLQGCIFSRFRETNYISDFGLT